MSVSPFNRRLRHLHRERFELLREWYGDDFARTEVSAHISRPRRLGQAVQLMMERLESPEARALRQLRELWPEIAGTDFSRMAIPLSWQGEVLILEVRHSSLLRELKPSLEFIRAAVTGRFPEVACREIRLTISGGGRSR